MKAFVDQDRCVGCGGCVASFDTVFEFNEDGLAYAKDEVISPEDEEQVKEFVDNKYCPGDAISYE